MFHDFEKAPLKQIKLNFFECDSPTLSKFLPGMDIIYVYFFINIYTVLKYFRKLYLKIEFLWTAIV